jgi:hypothetical protein
MRRPGFAAPGFLIIAALLLVGLAGAAPALAFQDASPAAETPAAAQPTEAPAQPAETPAATPAAEAPAAPAQTDVVTLVLWYSNPVDQDIIELFPLATDAGFVASPAPGAAPAGTVDFPVDGVTPPTIVIGDTTFETYPRPDGVIERWTWLDDFEGARPGTLVMQLAGTDGTYANFYGTATMISRDEGGVGGVIVVALRPPAPAAVAEEEAAAEAPAEEPVAEEPVAEEPLAEEQPADAAGGIVIEGEVPAEGEAAAEPAE